MGHKLWNIVLAAGAGRRLASVTGGIPKQFWSVDGGRTLLEDTLRRSAPLAPPAQHVVVVDRAHEPYVTALPQLAQSNRVVYQPRDRGTAVGVLLGLMDVVAAAPDALVLLTPADHGVRRPHSFVAGVRRAALEIDAGRRQVVLFGATPTEAVGDYGWITPGAPCAGNDAFRPVTAFSEKPALDTARRLFESGAVWNTMVLLARASALLELYRQHLPSLIDSFLPALSMSAPERPAVLQEQYDQVPAADFSRDLLTHAGGLSVYTWPAALGWSDLGTPDRLARWRAMDFVGRTTRALRDGTAPQRLQPAS